MAPAKPARKRSRKRKRRATPSSSSSDSSSSEEENPKVVTPQIQKKKTLSESSESSESDSDSTSNDSEIIAEQAQPKVIPPRRHSPSPPPIVEKPSLIPFGSTEKDNDELQKEIALKEKFRKFWMASVADGFKDDLEQIRKVCVFNSQQFVVLIPAL